MGGHHIPSRTEVFAAEHVHDRKAAHIGQTPEGVSSAAGHIGAVVDGFFSAQLQPDVLTVEQLIHGAGGFGSFQKRLLLLMSVCYGTAAVIMMQAVFLLPL